MQLLQYDFKLYQYLASKHFLILSTFRLQFKSMQKLSKIINLNEVTEGYRLKEEFHAERAKLKNTLKGLKYLKDKNGRNKLFFSDCSTLLSAMIMGNSNFRNKCEIDYYSEKGCEVFAVLEQNLKKPAETYINLKKRLKFLIDKVESYLKSSKQNFSIKLQAHQKVIEQYASICFPQTTSLLFKLGFLSGDKLEKVRDALKEESLIDQSLLFNSLVEEYLQQMQNLQNEGQNLGKEYFLGVQNEWKQACLSMIGFIDSSRIDDDKLKQYRKTSKATKSSKSSNSLDVSMKENEDPNF